MHRIECSVWSNGKSGFGLRVLGGPNLREEHFDRTESPVLIDIDGKMVGFNVDKNSFWKDCGELIGKALKPWFQANDLRPGDRVWLEVIEPKQQFRLLK